MSRQKGSRPRSAPDERRYREQYSQQRRRRTAAAPAADTGSPAPSPGRKLGAVIAATVVLVFAFTAVISALVAYDEGDDRAARIAVAVAVGLVPVAFTLLARISRAPHPFRRVLLASPLAIAGYVALGALVREPTSTLVLAFGIAGAYLLRLDPPARLSSRFMAVGITATLSLLLYVVAASAAVIAAPFLPFLASLMADRVVASRSASALPG